MNGTYPQVSGGLQAAFDTASAHFQAGRIDEAKLACRDILAADPGHADTIQLYGLIAHIAGEPQIAASLIGRAIQLKGAAAPPEYFNNMGLALRAIGQDDTAIAHFRQAAALKPDQINAYLNLAQSFQAQGQFDEAVNQYRRAAAIQPENPEIFHHMGGAFYASGKRQDAAVCYEKALALKPDYAEAHNDLGVLLKDAGQFDAAMMRYERALNLNPDNPDTHYNMGLLLQDKGVPDKALASFERAAALGNPSAPFWVSTLKGAALDQAPQTLRRMMDALDADRRYGRAADSGLRHRPVGRGL